MNMQGREIGEDSQYRGIPQFVADCAAAQPKALAVVSEEQALTYGELNRRANQLAHTLQRLGIGPNRLVAVCLERSPELVVALLGVLKAGGAYVPLDPAYPPERLAFMLNDAQAPVLITRQRLTSRFAPQQSRLLCLDTDAALIAGQPVTNPVSSSTASDLAYVIYTSGSTGQPKGVQIVQSGLLNLVCWHQRAFDVTAADRATQIASPAFDAAGWELWPYLSSGASVYLPDEETRATPALLRDWLVEQQITMTFLPTPLAESVMALEWPPAAALRFLLTGADMLHHYPSPRLPFALINNYGPTEATVVATSGQVFPQEHPDGPPAIGRPIDHTQVYILDERLQPVPDGQAGELYIGGAGLARGYLNQPELTSERFIPHPFSQEPGARLYKTGDIVRALPDGQLAFIGRSDYQIKIRGYRIEPNEVIAALKEYPAVEASAVMAREDAPDDKRLVAYVVPAPESDISLSALQEHLRARLPDYMMPTTFVQLGALPLTPNGKVNQAALPAPDENNILRERSSARPCTPMEERVEAMVATLLKVEHVGVEENFFMMGGHSLLGAQLLAWIAETFGVELALRTLFEVPTVRMLAAEIEQRLLLAKIAAMDEEEALRLLEHG